jgi:hypothetical protein
MEIFLGVFLIVLVGHMLNERIKENNAENHRLWLENIKEQENKILHGTDRINEYHWGGKYAVREKESGIKKHEYSGKPPIWLNDEIELVWYFDKNDKAAKREGYFHSHYVVKTFETYIADGLDEELPLIKLSYLPGKSERVASAVDVGDEMYIYTDYKDGTRRPNKVLYDGVEIDKSGTKMFSFKYERGNLKRVSIGHLGLSYCVVPKVIGLAKVTNSEKKNGRGRISNKPISVRLDEYWLYFRLKGVRDIPMSNTSEIMNRVQDEKNSPKYVK